ncbi:MAG: signal recognition particle protein [Clostridiales bacterium]|nr:signal recognition particle protein [Clostridiales bacterium]
MAFEGLSDRMQNIMRKLRGKARITESDLKEINREIKLTLLEADVNFKVVKTFISNIEEKALGEEVMKSLTPGQQVVKIVRDELTNILGSENVSINFEPSNQKPTVVMLVGLQGAGKTTLAGKLANHFRKQGKKPLLVACDIYRPAAIEQLKVVGKNLNIPVYANDNSKNVVSIAKEGINKAISSLNDLVIVDTAGRLQIDDELMSELEDLKREINPNETLLVVDSMSGQDAANVAKTFSEKIEIDGVVLTKLDADTRGGSALSIKEITGKPIKFASVGEKLSDLEAFYPDRMASRILGMGDVLSIIEKAEAEFSEEEAKALEEKIKKQEYDLNDYLNQMKKIKKMGSLSSLVKMIPGMGSLGDIPIDDKEIARTEAIIQSMTEEERKNYKILNGSRRKRIALGSGTSVEQVNKFIKSFDLFKKVMKDMRNPNDLKKIMSKLRSGGYGKF